MSQATHAQAVRAIQSGDLRAAEAHCREALAQNPDDAGVLNTLAVILSRTGRMRDAAGVLARLIALDNANPLLMFNLGSILQRLGRHHDAARYLRQSVDLHPDLAEAHAALARSLNVLGDHPGAAQSAEQALWTQAANAPALVEMARAERQGGAPASARDRLSPATEWSDIAPRHLALIWNELARAHDALGEYDAAFDAFEKACAVRLQAPEFARLDPRVHEAMIRQFDAWAVPGCTMGWPDSWAKAPSNNDPAFIVGFLRSGTTLAERIVGAHPRLATTDEALAVPRLLSAIGLQSVTGVLSSINRLKAMELQRAYHQFLRQTMGDDLPEGARIVDKLALNIINLPIIRRVFAGSKVIVTIRDPRDVCLSCLMQAWDANFTSVRFGDMASIARVYAEVMGLWSKYRDVLGLDFTQLRYEQLVADTPGEARRIIDFLGENWDDAVLGYRDDAAARTSTTPGAEAVARPVYDSSIGRWRRYAHRMGPALETLQPFVESFAYDKA